TCGEEVEYSHARKPDALVYFHVRASSPSVQIPAEVGEHPIETYQSLVSEGIIDASDEKPERPQIFKSELQDKVGQKDKCPHYQEFQWQKAVCPCKPLKVPPEINQFTQALDWQTASQLLKSPHKVVAAGPQKDTTAAFTRVNSKRKTLAQLVEATRTNDKDRQDEICCHREAMS
ncbi:hypothetical protein U0070_000336, partial [Myodes glareolus]